MAGFPVEQIGSIVSVEIGPCVDRALDADSISEDVKNTYARELERSRANLYALVAGERFRYVLLQSSPDLELLSARMAARGPPVRNAKVRMREYTWVSYLQRITTKNDTISIYGPLAWGTISRQLKTGAELVLDDAGISHRIVYIEKWVCERIATAMSNDPDVVSLLVPELADDLLLEGGEARLLASGKSLELTGDERAFLSRGDGPKEIADALIAKRALVRRIPVPISQAPFDELRREVASWPAGPAKERWAPKLEEIERRRRAIEETTSVDVRRPAFEALTSALVASDIDASNTSQALYAGRLPINEDCIRGMTRCELGAPLIEQLTVDLAPWYELWRDLASLYATRFFDAIVPVFRSLAAEGPVRLPSLLAATERAGVAIRETGGVHLPNQLDADVKRAWQEELGDRLETEELTLTDHELGFLRRRFSFRRMKAFDWPAPDVQLSAESLEAVREGRFEVMLAELHSADSLWMLWGCPAPEALAASSKPNRRPALVFLPGREYDSTVHAFVRAPQFMPDFTFTAGLRMNGRRSLRSAEITVHLEDGDDLVLRDPSGVFLGSLIHSWLVAKATHRFEFCGEGPCSPRLRVGRVVVQRRSWSIEVDEELRKRTRSPGVEQVIALRRLRRDHDLPEEVFVRPHLPVRGTYLKDAKPVFADFRSPLLLEIMAKTVQRYRRLIFAEALPRTDQCWLRDDRGRYSFELRMLATAKERDR